MKKEMKTVRIALVGTPGAGKTTVTKILKKSIRPSSYTVGFVEEAATMLMHSSAANRQLRETDPVAFQDMVADTHIKNEGAGILRAQRDGAEKLLQITDRALMDAYVYLNDEQRTRLKRPIEPLDELNQRYDAVICFDYYDCGAWLKAGNNVRAEKALSDIKRVCERSKEVYSTHPRFYLVRPCDNVREKAARVAEIINEVVGEEVFRVEIE